jgi:hypothetical protein
MRPRAAVGFSVDFDQALVSCHSIHAHSADADEASASRQQSMVTTMHRQRVVMSASFA